MALTREQFDQLYNQGLSVEQITSFEGGKKPRDLNPPGAIQSMVQSVARVPLKVPSTLAVAGAQAVATGAKLLGAKSADRLQAGVDTAAREGIDYGYFGKVKGFGQTGSVFGDIKEATGAGLEAASYLIGGGGATRAVARGFKGQLLRGAGIGTATGAASGGLASFGMAIQEAENKPAAVAMQTLFGTAIGAGAGLALGAATPVAVKTVNGIKTFTSFEKLSKKLYDSNKLALRPTARQMTEWAEKKVDPIKTLTEEFGPEAIPTSKNKLELADMIEQVDVRYRAGAEGFNTILRNSPEVVSLSQRQAQALASVERSGLTPSQKLSAKAKVDNEFIALKAEAQKGGFLLGDDNVPVAYADNLKDRFWGATRNFGTEESTVANSVNRNIGHAFKDGIEEVVTDVNVRTYNKRLQELIMLRDFLESQNGKVPGTGGKFTRRVASIIGATAGLHGGPIGVATGAMSADAVAQMLVNPGSRTWLIRKQFEKLAPEVRKSLQEEAEIIIGRMAQKRAETFVPSEIGKALNDTPRLPAPSGSNIDINQGRPVPVRPSGSKGEYVGGETIVEPFKNTQGGFIQMFKDSGDITTKILKDLDGKTTVSKTYIMDATNRGEIKQIEKDVIREALASEGDTVNAKQFAEKVKRELLPLKRVGKGDKTSGGSIMGNQYEQVTLPDDLRGAVASYSEHVYESPIPTSAGETHFRGAFKNYFGHTRVEDLPDIKPKRYNNVVKVGDDKLMQPGGTRRVIEVQSDLYQKGKLADERSFAQENLEYLKENGKQYKNPEKKLTVPGLEARLKEVAKLQQYNDPTAHFRMIREEIKRAAEDGKTKLQFPTGETAMKIEGLGSGEVRWTFDNQGPATPGELKVGKEIWESEPGMGMTNEEAPWVITDVFGDGRFKAIQKRYLDEVYDGKVANANLGTGSNYIEEFDISGKVDSNNPIYRFYEKEVQRYLNRFGGKKVTDAQGVTWIEVPIKKEYASQPVEAFGKIATSPLFIGAAGTGALSAISQFLKKEKE